MSRGKEINVKERFRKCEWSICFFPTWLVFSQRSRLAVRTKSASPCAEPRTTNEEEEGVCRLPSGSRGTDQERCASNRWATQSDTMRTPGLIEPPATNFGQKKAKATKEWNDQMQGRTSSLSTQIARTVSSNSLRFLCVSSWVWLLFFFGKRCRGRSVANGLRMNRVRYSGNLENRWFVLYFPRKKSVYLLCSRINSVVNGISILWQVKLILLGDTLLYCLMRFEQTST